ncbi:GNAT family N-acetyltransferase [Nocardioides anomalus]|uniref:GNAT family N-acetyltransferase n=1 Tax=Nocardioides anomalus TaxID=2712223 RepID=A0A6G6WGM1_9ACTN|nr:GNAT family N-acetyltransferase [Nocardioides anomalus]QIG44359.1 GNAT family N-acetyltransferase [Nocardioides anomalus]
MAEATLRHATPDDAPALRVLGEAVVPATYAPIDPAYAEFTLAEWWDVDRMRESAERLWHGVADDGERLLGVANLGRSDERWVMWKLYVHPDAQGSGLGRRLLEATLEQVPDGEPLWLEYVDGNTRAAGFYAAHGFVESHREASERFPDLVWMRKDR